MNLLLEKKYGVPSRSFVKKMFCAKKVTKLPDLTVYTVSLVCRIAEGVEQDQKAAAKVVKERELRRRLREEDKEMEKKAKEAEDIMLGRRTKELINIKLYDK